MKKITYFLFILWLSLFSSNIYSQDIPCNGYPELCNRRFNEVAFIHTHNSTSNKTSPVQNQDRSIKEQLVDGVRSMKVPVHYDYNNLLEYYAELTQAYIDDINQKINAKADNISKQYEESQKKLTAAQDEVRKLNSEIDSTQIKINSIKEKIDELQANLSGKKKPNSTQGRIDGSTLETTSDQYKNLIQLQKLALQKSIDKFNKEKLLFASNEGCIEKPLNLAFSINDVTGVIKKGYEEVKGFTLSATDKAKISSQIARLGIELAGLETKKAALVASREVATQALEGLKKIIGVLESKLDPRIAPLMAEKGLAASALKILEALLGRKEGRIPFACHGLAKRELYGDFIGDLEKQVQVPDSIKPIMSRVFSFLKSSLSKGVTTAFGEKNETGGALPFTPCFIDRGREKLENFLRDIREFLDSHPNEVVSITLELYAINYDHIWDAFYKSGLIKYVYTQNPSEAWPTLGEMVRSGKRLVVFIDSNGNPKYPWLHPWIDFEGWETRWGYSSPDEFTKKAFNINDVIKRKRPIGSVDNKLINVTHSITTGLAGSRDASKIVNSRDVLRTRMKNISEAINHIPNFISLDFYEYPNKDVFDVLDEINGVGKYKDNPLWKAN